MRCIRLGMSSRTAISGVAAGFSPVCVAQAQQLKDEHICSRAHNQLLHCLTHGKSVHLPLPGKQQDGLGERPPVCCRSVALC